MTTAIAGPTPPWSAACDGSCEDAGALQAVASTANAISKVLEYQRDGIIRRACEPGLSATFPPLSGTCGPV